MSDGSDPPRRDPDGDWPPPRGGHDIRDDFDDDFALTPRDRVRRRLLAPAIAFIAIGVLLVLGVIALAVGIFVENFGHGSDLGDYFLVALLLMLVSFGGGLFGLVVIGGFSMLRLRRHWLALFAAYVVTGLSIAGCYAILFFPFGIWALILLYQPSVREEFRRPAPVDD